MTSVAGLRWHMKRRGEDSRDDQSDSILVMLMTS